MSDNQHVANAVCFVLVPKELSGIRAFYVHYDLAMSDSHRNKDGATHAWYGVSFVAVMAACAVLVFLLQSFGFAVDKLGIAVLVGSLFHTLMSVEGLQHFPVVNSTDDKAIHKKVDIVAGTFGGLVNMAVLLLIIFVWQWLNSGRVVTYILFMSGLFLPPALGAVTGFHLAKKMVRRR